MTKRILAVASNGGHLVQLTRLAPVFDECKLTLISTSKEAPTTLNLNKYYCVTDSNFDQKLKLFITAWQTLFLVLKVRPNIIVTTGAAPGLFCVLWGAMLGKKVIWIDSIANSERLSLAGRIAKRLTKHCYTQWPDLATPRGPKYIGSVI